jgi:hypothetical protein
MLPVASAEMDQMELEDPFLRGLTCMLGDLVLALDWKLS